MEPSLETLITWTRSAGSILREGYGKEHQIDHKGRIDLVTEMDRRSEDYLIGEIRLRFPGHMIDSEESGLLAGAERERWYIDPLDGTTNYAHAIPVFSVSLAYASAGHVRLGVVYDPMRDECFSAERGRGAWLNGEPIHVSDIEALSESVLVTGFPYDSRIAEENLSWFAHFTRLSQGMRRMGSAALDLCGVAAGRFEGYWELTLSPWDFAAGALIVQEAGGRVSRVTGEPEILRPPCSILAANPRVFPEMLKEFNPLR